MKKTLLCLLTLFISLGVKALPFTVDIQNNTTEPLNICIMYYSEKDGFNGWVSEGWFKILPNEKRTVGTSISISKKGKGIYVYAKSLDGKKEYYGKDGMARNDNQAYAYVTNEIFNIKNCGYDYNKDIKGAYKVNMLFFPFDKRTDLLGIDHYKFQQVFSIDFTMLSRAKTNDGKKWIYFVDLNRELPSQYKWIGVDNNFTEPVEGALEWLKRNGYKYSEKYSSWYKVVK